MVDTSMAMPVDPSRVKVPKAAGAVQPAKVLPEHLGSTFLDAKSRVREGWEHAHPARFCLRIAAEHEPELRLRFLESGMSVLLAEDLVPRFANGRLLLAGMFAVPHKHDSDRLIVDRRPANQGEHRLHWSELPYGPMLTRLHLQPHEVLRGTGDDLRTFFYQLENAPEAITRNAFGRGFDGQEYERFGGLPGVRYRLALRVVAMGDTNAVDVAQATHRALLQRHGCLTPAEELV